MNLFEKFGDLVWRFRHAIVILSTLAFLILTPFAAKVTPDNSLEAISVAHDPHIELIHRVEALFGSEEYIIIEFETDSIFSKQSLQVVNALSQFLQAKPEIENTLSLTTLSKVKNEDDTLSVLPFLNPQWIETGVPADEIENLLNTPLYKQLIYNKEGTATAVIAQLIPSMGGEEQKKSAVINSIREYAETLSKQSGLRLYFFGLPVVNRAIYNTVEKEQNTLTPLMILAITLLISYLYRNVYITCITLLQFLMTLGVVMGILGVFHVHLNWLTSFAPAVMIIMSICDAVYVINEFQRADYTLPARERLKRAFKNIGAPCLFTSITNAFAFASLLTSPIRPLQQYGLYVTLAVLIEFLISFTIFPLLLNNPRSKGKNLVKAQNPFLKTIVNKIYELVINRPKAIALFCSFLFILSVLGALELEANQYTLNLFKTDTYHLVEANDFIKKGVGGGIANELLIDTDKPGTLLEPELLNLIDAAGRTAMIREPAIKKALSLADLVKYFNQAWHNNDPAYYKIPDTKKEVAQLVLLMEMDREKLRLREFVNADYSKGVSHIYTQSGTTLKQALKGFEISESTMHEFFDKSPYPAVLTSKGLVACRVMHYLSETVVVSLITSGVFIILAMMILLRSVYVGFLALLPSILPILMMMGIMGYFGIWINIATAMTFAVSLGIAMDDTVNIMWRMRQNIVEQGMDYEPALKKVYDEIGVPLISSSLLLASGYLMLSFSKLSLTTTFGMLVAFCCLLALVGDLFLTPLLLLKLRPFTKKKK